MIAKNRVLTLDEFTTQDLRNFPHATGELSRLLRDIGLAAKRINVEVNKAGIADILGYSGSINVQGEDVMKLDDFANKQIVSVLQNGISCAGIVSEEMETMLVFDDSVSNTSKYVVMADPIDGSSNIDVNITIGTIFGIYKRTSKPGSPCTMNDFLQPGKNQIAAGYIIYGSSTMMVYATKNGVNGFTLDPAIGEFCLSHPNIQCPENGSTYSFNHGNFSLYHPSIKQYINSCQQKKNLQQHKYIQRYSGSMVADIHRNLLKGGIFMYPDTVQNPKGKLRLQYECNPIAFMYEIAGGMATNGEQRILDIEPEDIHQRSPIFVGSKKMMVELSSYQSIQDKTN